MQLYDNSEDQNANLLKQKKIYIERVELDRLRWVYLQRLELYYIIASFQLLNQMHDFKMQETKREITRDI